MPEYETSLGPAQNGALWPYIPIPLIGVGFMVYLMVDLYGLLTQSGPVQSGDWPILWGMLGITFVFALVGVALWFAPWSRAHMHIDGKGLSLRVTGLQTCDTGVIPWQTLKTVSLVTMPRGGSVYRFDMSDRPSVRVSALAFAIDTAGLLDAVNTGAQSAGLHLSGKPLTAPIIGTRTWQVVPIA